MTFNDMTMREKVIRRIVLILFIIVLFLILYLAYSHFVSAVPTIKPYVNDFVGIMNSDQKLELNNFLYGVEQNTTYEIVIVVTKDTERQDANSYATDIGNENGVGQKGKENGIVILLAIESRQNYIAVGRGAESIINDAKAGRIARENTQLYFKNGQYYEGLYQEVMNLSSELKGENIGQTDPLQDEDATIIIIFICVIFAILMFAGIILKLFDVFPSSQTSYTPTPYFPSTYRGSSSRSSKRSTKDDEDDDEDSYSSSSTSSDDDEDSSSGGYGSFGGGSFGGGGGGASW